MLYNVLRISAYFCLLVLTQLFLLIDDQAWSNSRAVFLPLSAFLGHRVVLFF